MDVQVLNLMTDALMDPKRIKSQVNLVTVTPYAVDHRVNFDRLPIPGEDFSLAL